MSTNTTTQGNPERKGLGNIPQETENPVSPQAAQGGPAGPTTPNATTSPRTGEPATVPPQNQELLRSNKAPNASKTNTGLTSPQQRNDGLDAQQINTIKPETGHTGPLDQEQQTKEQAINAATQNAISKGKNAGVKPNASNASASRATKEEPFAKLVRSLDAAGGGEFEISRREGDDAIIIKQKDKRTAVPVTVDIGAILGRSGHGHGPEQGPSHPSRVEIAELVLVYLTSRLMLAAVTKDPAERLEDFKGSYDALCQRLGIEQPPAVKTVGSTVLNGVARGLKTMKQAMPHGRDIVDAIGMAMSAAGNTFGKNKNPDAPQQDTTGIPNTTKQGSVTPTPKPGGPPPKTGTTHTPTLMKRLFGRKTTSQQQPPPQPATPPPPQPTTTALNNHGSVRQVPNNSGLNRVYTRSHAKRDRSTPEDEQ